MISRVKSLVVKSGALNNKKIKKLVNEYETIACIIKGVLGKDQDHSPFYVKGFGIVDTRDVKSIARFVEYHEKSIQKLNERVKSQAEIIESAHDYLRKSLGISENNQHPYRFDYYAQVIDRMVEKLSNKNKSSNKLLKLFGMKND